MLSKHFWSQHGAFTFQSFKFRFSGKKHTVSPVSNTLRGKGEILVANERLMKKKMRKIQNELHSSTFIIRANINRNILTSLTRDLSYSYV